MHLDECFLGRLRSRAAKAKIIIVNHYLFFADLKVKKSGFGEVIPRFQVAVFDEAHAVEEIATAYLGEALSTNQLMELVSDLEKETKDLSGIDKGKLKQHLNIIKTGSENLRAFFHAYGDKGRLDHETVSVIRNGPAREIRRGLKYLREKANFKGLDHPGLQSMVVRATEMDDLLDEILKKRNTNWLNWYEKRKRSMVLHASPLDISDRMNDLLYEKVQTVVFTSATLSTNKTFDYIRTRLGLPAESL